MLHEIEIKRLRHIAQRQGDGGEGSALLRSGRDEGTALQIVVAATKRVK